MYSSPVFDSVINDLNSTASFSINDNQEDEIFSVIKKYAIAAAVAGLTAGVAPGVGNIVSVISQAGLVGACYLQINKIMGISMSQQTAKFIGTTVCSTLALNVPTLLYGYGAAIATSFFPLLGRVFAVLISSSLGFMITYVASIIYLMLIEKWACSDGSIRTPGKDEAERTIKNLIENADIESIITEGRNFYKQAKEDGLIHA